MYRFEINKVIPNYITYNLRTALLHNTLFWFCSLVFTFSVYSTWISSRTTRINLASDYTVLDGAVRVQMYCHHEPPRLLILTPRLCSYHMQHHLNLLHRLDIVWDVYNPNSLKGATREKMGKRLRSRIYLSLKVLTNWQSFLCVSENKTELFHVLAKKIQALFSKVKRFTALDQVLLSPVRPKNLIEPCSREETDTRIVLHLVDVAHEEHKNIMVRTLDIDVGVFIVSNVHNILWISFGTGKLQRYIRSHEIAARLDPSKGTSLVMFHSFNGSDTTTFFAGLGKRIVWNTWTVFPDVIDAFLELVDVPFKYPWQHIWFTGEICFSNVQQDMWIVQAKWFKGESLCKKSQNFGEYSTNISSSSASCAWSSLLRRTCVEASAGKETHTSKSCRLGLDWKDGSWKPKWTSIIGQAQDACYELIHCNCKKKHARVCVNFTRLISSAQLSATVKAPIWKTKYMCKLKHIC